MKYAKMGAFLSLLSTHLILLFPANMSAQIQGEHIGRKSFGMHMSMDTDPWPTGQIPGSDRMWNAWGAQRIKVNPAEGVYHWDAFDKFLAGARLGVATGQSLQRTGRPRR
jgi:hypothetical protein